VDDIRFGLEGRPIIAQRFIAGKARSPRPRPGGTVDRTLITGSTGRPSGTEILLNCAPSDKSLGYFRSALRAEK